MAKTKIGTVTVVFPSTPDGMMALRDGLIRFNTRLMECLLDKCDAPLEDKLRYLESLNGIVPWATNRDGDRDFEEWCQQNMGRRFEEKYSEE